MKNHDVVEFRTAQPSDTALLAALRKQAREETYRGIYTEEFFAQYDLLKNQAEFLRQIEHKIQQIYLIYVDEQLAGYFTFGKPQYWFPKTADPAGIYLNGLYILQLYWRQGIGLKVFRFVMDYCREQGIEKLYNNCNMHNVRAIAFYQAMGGSIIYQNGGHTDLAEDQLTFEYWVK